MSELLAERPANWGQVEAARDGNREAFGMIWQAYRRKVYGFALARVGSEPLAEDLVQETFLRALGRIDHIEWQGRDLGAWLITIARNLVADHFKSSHYRRSMPSAGPLAGDEEIGPLDRIDPVDVAKVATDRPIAVLLWQAVSQLPTDQRDCIRLRFAYGLTVLETATVMSRNEGAVKALQYRACHTLRRLLASSGLAEVTR